ncbi:hypothetical protein [Arthrobacter oryzae]|uniref:Uncharacterized protein n=1 Tax=Arthrobacter oryzae TaxID=409290 RepID=A0A3N0BUB0_9MICC|nr:hypothetical protein [Arthrobacter oryzae]RNL52737.1 hypothetical protein D7003_13585 [Arthrobacter oryzae]
MWNYGNQAFVEEIWPEAADIESSVYFALMLTANALCVAYAPVLADGAVVPDSWKLAEIFQARHTWSQFNGGNRDEIGADGYAVPVYPLVFAARDLLRPKSSPLSRLR